MTRCRPRQVAAVLSCAAFVAACTTRATSTPPMTAATLPPPNMVIVDNFALPAKAVQVDTSIGATARRVASGSDTTDEQARAVAGVQGALRDSLVKSINAMNLPVRSRELGPVAPPYVEIRGTLQAIDEGNQTRRNVVGFGAGKSSVTTRADVLYVGPGAAPVLLQSYQAEADSGRMPGFGIGAAGAAVGRAGEAAAGGAAKVATSGHADIDNEAERVAKALAAKIGTLFAQQGWVAAEAVPSEGVVPFEGMM